MNTTIPAATLEETALGIFLHDIGKFLQRAHGASRHLTPEVKARESLILPVHQSRYSHWHALWTDQFFDWLEKQGLSFPAGINRNRVRDVAVYHHEPEGAKGSVGALGHLAAEADRLSAGMDRKPRDEEEEGNAEPKGRDGYIKTPLRSPFAAVEIGLGKAPEAYVPLGKLEAGPALFPCAAIRKDEYPQRYERLWKEFQADCQGVFRIDDPGIFCEALLSLSERYLCAVPSSTRDQPDVSLHDHSRSAAALGAALYQWHREDGSLQDPVRIRDRKTAKFRMVMGDLAGIQSSLFLLASQRVKGVSRILRARSFLMGMVLEGALVRCREELTLPAFSVLQNAGGRFLLLAANTAETETAVGRVREEVERWLYDRYLGELALNLAVTEPFSGEELMQAQFPRLLERMSRTAEKAKLRAFSTCLDPVHRQSFPLGPCAACGVRPAARSSREEDGEEMRRCVACGDEARLGGGLPRTRFLAWSRGGAEGPHVELFGGLRLHWLKDEPFSLTPYVSAMRLPGGEDAPGGPLPLRYVANYVPRFRDGEAGELRYAGLGAAAAGEVKTFEHLARDAWAASDSGFLGEDHLAVIKADVDRLGTIFSEGVPRPSLGAFASLSRMMDFFFTGQLPYLLEREFPSTYTVYAGGDDLLLISPWRQALDLVVRLRARFGEWTAGNPNVTLSAAVELIKANHPLHRAAGAAEERLASAKAAGRDKVSAIDGQPMGWSDFAGQVSRGKELAERMLGRELQPSFVHQILYFAEQRLRAEAQAGTARGKRELDLQAATWRARWGYQVARHLDRRKQPDLVRLVNQLLGLDGELRTAGLFVPPRVAITLALYSVRNSQGRR
jgi:CRISPR-associated protein Csm1